MKPEQFDAQFKGLANDLVRLQPIQEKDFEALYEVASDPEIWLNHPNKNRYEKDVFRNFFEGAMQSKGAFLIIDQTTNQIIGSTRYYDFNAVEKTIIIGYTFFAKAYWGKGYNHATKSLMLNYAFQFVELVEFHVGASNFPSQKAITKLGAKKVDEVSIAYYGEPNRLNFIYHLKKSDWITR